MRERRSDPLHFMRRAAGIEQARRSATRTPDFLERVGGRLRCRDCNGDFNSLQAAIAHWQGQHGKAPDVQD